MRLQNLDTVG